MPHDSDDKQSDAAPSQEKVAVESLSIRELRALLDKLKIDYTGVLEKEELVALAKKHSL